MNESKKHFVDQLLKANPPSADARRHYEKEMRAMFEKTLARNERRGYLLSAVLMGADGIRRGYRRRPQHVDPVALAGNTR